MGWRDGWFNGTVGAILPVFLRPQGVYTAANAGESAFLPDVCQ